MKKNSCTPSNIPKNIHGLASKNNSYQGNVNEKNSCGQEPITPDAAQKFATLPITFSSSRRNLRCCVTVAVTEIIASLLVCLCQSPIEKWRPSSVQQKDKWRTGHVTFPPTTYNIYNHIPRTRSSYKLKLEKSVVII